MLSYTDTVGNSVIHIMAKQHDKKLLFGILAQFKSYLNLNSNNDGFTPGQLYETSKSLLN